LIRKDGDAKGVIKPFESIEKNLLSRLQNQKISELINKSAAAIPVTIDEAQLQAISLPTDKTAH